MLFGEKETTAERVLLIEFVTGIELEAIGKNITVNARRDPVKDEITHVVRPKKNRAVTGKDGRLKIEIIDFLLVSNDRVKRVLALIFIEFRRVKR